MRTIGGRSQNTVGPDRAKHVNTVEQHFARRSMTGFGYWTKLDYFLARSVFRAGLGVKCPTCAHKNWFDLDSVAYSLSCARCLKPFMISQTPATLKELKWHYRVIGPFAAPGFGRGGYAVALTLRCLAENHDNELTWSTGLKLKELNCEVDSAWYRRGSHGGERDEPVLVIGEAKSFGKNAIKDEDIAALRAVGERFPGTCLVVASLRQISEYTQEEKQRLTDLANWGRRSSPSGWEPVNPVIVLTATELFSEFGIAQAWKEVGGQAAELVAHASVDLDDLYRLAEATQKLYLNLPSFYNDYGARLRSERSRLVVLLRSRSMHEGFGPQ